MDRDAQEHFAGKRVGVTGAARGIGHATALRLIGCGAQVVACDLVEDGLKPLVDKGAESCVADLVDPGGRDDFATAVGQCDHLVVAHGIVRPTPVEATTETDWDDVMSTNAKSVFFTCQRFGDCIRPGGSIVTVSSVSARSAASIEQSVYCASKAALSSITRSFAYAYAPRNVRVNAVLPGIVQGEMQNEFLEATAKARGSTPDAIHEARMHLVPLGRAASAHECAETIVWLLSPAASYITGQQIAVDGGLTMV